MDMKQVTGLCEGCFLHLNVREHSAYILQMFVFKLTILIINHNNFIIIIINNYKTDKSKKLKEIEKVCFSYKDTMPYLSLKESSASLVFSGTTLSHHI